MSSNGSLVEKKGSSPDSKNVLGAYRGPVAGTDGVEIEYVESVPGDVSLVDDPKPKKSKRQRFRRHCARFWCCYLFWNVIFLAIFLPIFFLVVIPAVAQLVVNKSTLLLVNATLIQPRPDSVMLTLEAALDLPIELPVRIEPLVLEVYDKWTDGNNTIFSSRIDGATIDGNTTLGVQNRFTPLNVPLWTDYVHRVVTEPNAPLPVRGSTNAYLGILKSHVKVDKDIHQHTLNSFAGFSIDDPKLLLSPREDGVNLIANATLPNPSVMTLQIGTTLLDLKSGEYLLGNATIDDLMLYPGNHSVPVEGIIDLDYLISNLGEILKTQSDALNRGFLRLEAVGRNVTFNGVEIPYYAEAMRKLTLTADVSLGSLITNSIDGILKPNGTNIFANLTDPNGPTNIHDIINSIDDPDNSLGLNNNNDNSDDESQQS
ncbi:hypothetical protein BJX68DRAFT_277661 [Aspergillus pseudodeflectus]|uniref:Uncharacterized protein n=1 Tax=Aspergillus pseudodeflectus TaxID=176178 RepID=A0ABR4L359_9EURO